jgi:hypothetical protein
LIIEQWNKRQPLKPDTGEDDGQPTEQEEWHGYDPDC